jgi:hypothetical protein
MYQDTAKLDSAWLIAEEESELFNTNRNLYIQRIILLSMKKDYDACEKSAELMNDSLFDRTYIYIVNNRIKSIKAHIEHDDNKRDSLIKQNISQLEKILPKSEIDSVMSLKSEESIIKYSKSSYLIIYYDYLSKIYGKDYVKHLLEIYKEETDDDFCDFLIPSEDEKFEDFKGW